MSPFNLLFGKHGIKHTFKNGKRGSAQSGAGAHPGRCLIHSAYPPCAWDMSAKYDKGVNAKRGRIGRLADEIDAATSGNKKHAIGDLNNGPGPVPKSTILKEASDSDESSSTPPPALTANRLQNQANSALSQAAFAKVRGARREKNDKENDIEILQRKMDALTADIERLERGEEPVGSQQQRQNAERDARARARAAGQAAGTGPGLEDYDSDDFEHPDSDAEDPIPLSPAASDDEDSDDSSSVASTASVNEKRRLARIEKYKKEVARLQRRIDDFDGERKVFEDAERAAMAEASGHITGMQAAAMYNVGITATIPGLMQRHGGSKTQTRLGMMQLPDAYNDLAVWDADANGGLGEYRMLVDPSQQAKKGSIKVKIAPVKRIGFFDLNTAANRNRFLEKWMLEHNRAHREAPPDPNDPNSRGAVVPQTPVSSRGFNGSYTSFTVPKAAYEDPNAQEAVGWVVDMMEEYTKAKKMQNRRMHNSWARNAELFTMALEELQRQRKDLKKVRRCAQGMIISGETRYTKQKDTLLSDLFVRSGHGEGELMHDVCAYNYAGERLSLYFREEALDPQLIKNIIEEPQDFLPKLRAYLSGDPTMHYRYLNKEGVSLQNGKLSDEWLKDHYIKPIREMLQRSVNRDLPTAQQTG